MKRLIQPVSLTIAIAFAVAGAAHAQNTVAPIVVAPADSIVVSYADLDLSADAGLRVLKARVSQAADRLCGDRSPHVIAEMQRRGCRSFALDGAAPQIAAARSSAMAAAPRTIVLARR